MNYDLTVTHTVNREVRLLVKSEVTQFESNKYYKTLTSREMCRLRIVNIMSIDLTVAKGAN